MHRLLTLLAFCVMSMSVGHGAAVVDPGLSAAEQAQLLADAKSRLDNWGGNVSVLGPARDNLTKLIAANPRNAGARVLLARYYMASGIEVYGRHDQGALDLAGQQLSVAYKIDPSSPNMLLEFANWSNFRHQPDQAHKFLDQAEAVHADEIAVGILRARAYLLDEKWKEAKASIDKVEKDTAGLRASTTFQRVSLHEVKGNLHLHFHQNDKAMESYRQITIIAPDYAWGHGNYAEIVLLWKGDYKTAISEAQRAIELMNYPAARFALGASQYVKWANMPQQSSDDAQTVLQSARMNAPDASAVMARVAGHVAAGLTLARLVQTLLKNGISIDSRDPVNEGCTPLTLTIIHDDMRSLEWLIAHKADVNARGIYDRTPVFLAVERDNLALVNRLIQLKADVNIPAVGGDTPLLTAAGDGNGRMVKILLDAGANPDARISGQDAAGIATFNGHLEVAQLLRDYKAKKTH